MIIKDRPIYFKKEESGKIYFKDKDGQELIIDKTLIFGYSDKNKELYLSLLESPSAVVAPKEILNEILKKHKEA